MSSDEAMANFYNECDIMEKRTSACNYSAGEKIALIALNKLSLEMANLRRKNELWEKNRDTILLILMYAIVAASLIVSVF